MGPGVGSPVDAPVGCGAGGGAPPALASARAGRPRAAVLGDRDVARVVAGDADRLGVPDAVLLVHDDGAAAVRRGRWIVLWDRGGVDMDHPPALAGDGPADAEDHLVVAGRDHAAMQDHAL